METGKREIVTKKRRIFDFFWCECRQPWNLAWSKHLLVVLHFFFFIFTYYCRMHLCPPLTLHVTANTSVSAEGIQAWTEACPPWLMLRLGIEIGSEVSPLEWCTKNMKLVLEIFWFVACLCRQWGKKGTLAWDWKGQIHSPDGSNSVHVLCAVHVPYIPAQFQPGSKHTVTFEESEN